MTSHPALTDSHAHLDFAVFDQDRQALIEAMVQQGIQRVLIPATEPARWSVQQQFARQFNFPYALGIHPWYCPIDIDSAIAQLVELLRRHRADPLLVALGECGLDKPRAQLPEQHPQRVCWQQQLALLQPQLALAQQLDLPLILHAVRCHGELQTLLRQYPGVCGVIHGFSGSYEVAMAYCNLGFRLGIGGLLLNPQADKLRRAVARLPLSALLVETDSPAMSPAGPAQRNTPLTLLAVVAEMARLRATTTVLLAEQLEVNYRQLFEHKKEMPEHPLLNK